jgi:hypothetical protein
VRGGSYNATVEEKGIMLIAEKFWEGLMEENSLLEVRMGWYENLTNEEPKDRNAKLGCALRRGRSAGKRYQN